MSAGEVAARRERYGRNDIVEVPSGRWLALVAETARDPMLWFLVATGGVYALLGEWTEAAVLLASLLPLAGMDAYLHRRTQASTQGLQGRLATRARVVRDGTELEIASDEVVVGELALVDKGEAFPADGVLDEAETCQVDESSLTGEAFPVAKRAVQLDRELARAGARGELALDAEHWGFAGTRVLTGRARLRVTHVGAETLYGGIVRSAIAGAGARTPLQQSVAALVRVLVVGAIVLCGVLALVRVQQGHGLLDALVSAMTLAIAALPEEFPVVFAVFLGLGVHRLARRMALVRRAVTVENIGRITTICSDKTGTITEGRLKLVDTLASADRSRDELLFIAACASQGDVGDPLDRAVLDARAAGAQPIVVARFPFTEDRRRETAVVETERGKLAATKGSPETIFALCELAPNELEAWRARTNELAALGRKVIACASQELDGHTWIGGEPDRNLRFDGLLAFEDPPRRGVRESVRECRDAGIRTIMVTGDHPATASAIARAIELASAEPRVVLGDELEQLLARAPNAVESIDVVARAIPAQKLTLVRALQARGEIVAVTGDGVNDVPALQAADIGIAMGARGTRSAREVASIVLLDDDFSSIVHAVAEGRQLFLNLQASFLYLMMIHVPLVLTAALIPLAGRPLVYLPIHIIWMELMIHPTAMLVFQDAPPAQRLERARRRASGAFFGARDWILIALVGALLTAGVTAAYEYSLGRGLAVEHARATALVAMTFASVGVMSVLSRLRSKTARGIAAASLAMALLLVQVPTAAEYLHLSPLHGDDWLIAALPAVLACLPLVVARRPGAR